MSRKPIDQQQPHECRQAIWAWIRDNELDNGPLAVFTSRDMDIMLEQTSIRSYLAGLARAGYLQETPSPRRGQLALYTLIQDCGVDAPRVRKDGSEVTQGIGRRQIWNAISILKLFSPRELAFNASTDVHVVAEGEVLTYCILLTRAGYLQKRDDGKYALIPGKWTGPHPPQVQRTKQIYDPNLRKVVYSKVEGGAE